MLPASPWPEGPVPLSSPSPHPVIVIVAAPRIASADSSVNSRLVRKCSSGIDLFLLPAAKGTITKCARTSDGEHQALGAGRVLTGYDLRKRATPHPSFAATTLGSRLSFERGCLPRRAGRKGRGR